MPIPFRDQEELEDLGAAAFLRIEAQADPAGYRGALFQINARGEPLEFTYNRVETPNTFLWRPADIRRAAARKLAGSLFGLSPRVPRLLLCLATETPPELFAEDISLTVPVGRIAHSLAELAPHGTPDGLAEVLDGPDGQEPLHLLWQSPPPTEGSPERLLLQRLATYGLLLEPFERASIGMDELYGAQG